ncbi:MAG: serine/threonine-protein kinase [Steroidobacteraceae bacterium]|nr:serine/threonine protein kinase [Pseudomonadota bacterium]MBP6107622.1 serine/threonine protein kinase [Steroidobacteraceae bacterium]
MTLRALIVSDRADYRQQLAHHITLEWRDALPAEYEPATRGRLPAGFTGVAYDVVLLDHEVQDSRGLEWLEDLADRPGFPPIVYFAPGGAGAVADKARSVGALAALTRTDFEHADLCGALRTALASRRNVLAETSRAALEQCPPDRFGSVRIRGHRCLRRLAVGGSSSVFLAESVRTGEQRVLKIFRQVPDIVEGSTTFDRFLREFDLVAHLRHPNIARIFDIGIADDHLYLAMEFFPGGDLRSRMRERLDPQQALGYVRQMAAALGALHEVGVLHRDVKPGNLLLREDGSAAFIDFGLARQLGLESDITGVGTIFGTPHYMSPEQGHGAPLDERSDLYSLGVVLFEMLTGAKPYVAETPLAVIYMHANSPVPRLPQQLSQLQPLLDGLLAKQPADRLPSAAAIVASIDELLKSAAA